MKNTWRFLSVSLLLAPLVGCAQKPASPPPSAAPPPQARTEDQAPPAGPGVAKGQPAPSFNLKDQQGVEHSLDEMRQSGPVAVVFFRSADWCPFCQGQLVQLQSDLATIQAAGITLVAISYDAPEILAKFAQEKSISFPLLSDAGSATVDAYQLRDPSGNGYPFPITYVIGKDGVVQDKLSVAGYRNRHSTQALLDAVKAIAP